MPTFITCVSVVVKTGHKYQNLQAVKVMKLLCVFEFVKDGQLMDASTFIPFSSLTPKLLLMVDDLYDIR